VSVRIRVRRLRRICRPDHRSRCVSLLMDCFLMPSYCTPPLGNCLICSINRLTLGRLVAPSQVFCLSVHLSSSVHQSSIRLAPSLSPSRLAVCRTLLLFPSLKEKSPGDSKRINGSRATLAPLVTVVIHLRGTLPLAVTLQEAGLVRCSVNIVQGLFVREVFKGELQPFGVG